MRPDIGSILDQWPYEPGQITVRRIRGADGKEKLQLRLDLGLLQMETAGRPDGREPYGHPSVLAYVEGQLSGYVRRHGDDHGFAVQERLVRELQDEALMNYHRYLSLYVLEDFEGVVRDTEANLRIFDLVSKYAAPDFDRRPLERYRPYVTMMNTRAKAQQAMSRSDYRRALVVINSGLAAIRSFFEGHGHGDLYRRSDEVAILQELRKEVSAHLPKDPVRMMERRLRRAVATERYEDAARLRDQIETLRSEQKKKAPRSNADQT